jgi:hypothetical protein
MRTIMITEGALVMLIFAFALLMLKLLRRNDGEV